MRFRLCSAAGLLALFTLFPSPGAAYCRTTTFEGQPSSCPEICETQGIPLYWPSKELRYRLNQRGFPGLSDSALRGMLATSFGAWEDIRCDGGDPIGLRIVQEQQTSSLLAGPQELEPNENVIAHVPPREWTDDRRAFAITKIWYNARNGHILGADMLFNGNMDPFGTCPPESGCPNDDITDLRNVVTHEAGHFLGLAHSDVEESTMWCDARPGETTKRDLAPDDAAGMCAIYADGAWLGPGTTGQHSVSDTCSVQGGAGSRGGAGLGALLMLAPLALLGRRRGRP